MSVSVVSPEPIYLCRGTADGCMGVNVNATQQIGWQTVTACLYQTLWVSALLFCGSQEVFD